MQKQELKVLKLINENLENWQEILTQKPYCLKINQDQDYYILSYDMIESDMSLEICQECRGLIIKHDVGQLVNQGICWDNYKVVCFPFKKFFNYGEPNYYELKNENLRVQEKVDGSLIKVWYDNYWHISTNGTINSINASLQFQTEQFKNYQDLFMEAWSKENISWNDLDPRYTYMFELVGPYNRIVIPYKEIKIYHIGTRNNLTLEEFECNLGIEKPKTYNLNTIEEIVKAASILPFDQEGYVVVDEDYNRNKIKSPAYLAVHYLRGQFNTINYRTILEIIFNKGQDDVLSYYPEYKEHFDLVQNKYNEYVGKIQKDIDEAAGILSEILYDLYLDDETCLKEKKKRFAKWATKQVNPGILFKCYDYGCNDWEEKFFKVKNKEGKIERHTLNSMLFAIGLKEEESLEEKYE